MKSKNVITALRFIWSISKCFVLLKLLISTLNALFPLLSANLVKKIIDTGVYNYDLKMATRYIVLLAVISIFYYIITSFATRIILKIQNKIELDLNKKIMYKLCKVKYSFFDNSDSYNSVESASREITNVSTVIDHCFNIFSAIISICFIFPYIISISIPLALAIVILNIPTLILQTKLKKVNVLKTKEVVYYKRCTTGTRGMLINKYYAGEVRVFSLFEWLFEKYTNYFNSAFKVDYERNWIRVKYDMIMKVTSIIMMMSVQITLIKYVIKRVITIGNFTMYNTYINRFNESIIQIINSAAAIYEKELFLNNLFNFINSDTNFINLAGDEKVINQLHSIEFHNVSFKYENSKENVLNNVSFEVKQGDILAIVGLNGAGKSTIFNLLLRFYKPNSGKIFLDGKDIESYDLKEYYNTLSVVFQSPKLYPFSLKENILFDNKDNKSDESLNFSWISSMSKKFPKGLNTTILPYFDNKGIEPSHGETQRIALARALSKESNILLLDEPSASMDAEVEYQLFSDLKNIFSNKTVIIISHRLSTVTTSTKIIFLKDGRIEECGNHQELLKLDGEYAKLFMMQAEKYTIE